MPTREQEAHSDLYGWLDGTISDLDRLANALAVAAEDGHFVQTDTDRTADINNHLQQAFDEVDSDDPDPEEVLAWCEGAAQLARDLHRGLDESARVYELPDHVVAGVHDTLGGYADYVYRQTVAVQHRAEEYAEAAAE
jgi:hypothetical protein